MPDIEQKNSVIDLSFLEQPLTKLAETVRDFTSLYTEPKKAVRMAEAGVEIDKIKALGAMDVEEAVAQRIKERIYKREIKRQITIDETVQEAAKYLPESVSNEPVKEGWKNQYFENMQDSDEEMRTYWAKILAGETANPGTFSLRTLHFVKTMSKDDADTLSLLRNFIWQFHPLHKEYFTFSAREFRDYFKSEGFSHLNLIYFQSIGLMLSESGFTFEINDTTIATFCIEDEFYEFCPLDNKHRKQIPLIYFSGIANELFQLIEPQKDSEYIDFATKALENDGLSITPSSPNLNEI